eukprot:115330-Karenia_brevis.AAC.1
MVLTSLRICDASADETPSRKGWLHVTTFRPVFNAAKQYILLNVVLTSLRICDASAYEATSRKGALHVTTSPPVVNATKQ